MRLVHRNRDLGRRLVDVAVPVVLVREEAAVRDADELFVA
jgi:hypothetical protein